MEASEEHPDFEVVDLGVWVWAVEFLFDGEDAVHEEGEEEFVAFGFLYVDHDLLLMLYNYLGIHRWNFNF